MKNDLPKNWKILKLSDLIQEKKIKKANEGSTPYIEIGDIEVETKKIFYKEKPSVKGAVIAPSRSILISRVRPTRGAVTLLSSESVVSNAFTIITPNDLISIELLYYFLAWNCLFYKYLERFQKGANYPSVSEKVILNFEIPVPPKKEQKRIVAILEEAEKLKKKREEANQRMGKLIPALFVKMFGDPATNPMGWEEVPLNNLGSLDRGKSQHRPRTAPELFNGIYPFIQTGDIANSGWKIKNYSKTYSEIGLAQSKLWPKNTLCITIAANIADTAILDFEACFPDSVVGFIPNENSNLFYVYSLFSFLKDGLEHIAPMAAQKNINLEILRNLMVSKPPIELQNKFAKKIEELEGQKTKQNESLKQIDTLFNSLMQKAFSGEL